MRKYTRREEIDSHSNDYSSRCIRFEIFSIGSDRSKKDFNGESPILVHLGIPAFTDLLFHRGLAFRLANLHF